MRSALDYWKGRVREPMDHMSVLMTLQENVGLEDELSYENNPNSIIFLHSGVLFVQSR